MAIVAFGSGSERMDGCPCGPSDSPRYSCHGIVAVVEAVAAGSDTWDWHGRRKTSSNSRVAAQRPPAPLRMAVPLVVVGAAVES